MLKLTLCAGLLGAALAGCGGSDSAGPADRLAMEKLSRPSEPGEQPAKLDTAPFVKLAQEAHCTDRYNRLYVIDRNYVFWNSAGTCDDASFAMRLYKRSADKPVCWHGDSVGGVQTSCTDEQEGAFFAHLIKHADASNLGLDASHTVEKVDLGPQAYAWIGIDKRDLSFAPMNRNLVIRDAAEWAALWKQHAPDEPAPSVDFASKMVIAVFGVGGPDLCHSTSITAMTLDSSKLVVVRTDISPGDAKIACLTSISMPAHIVTVDRVDVPVEFVVERRAL